VQKTIIRLGDWVTAQCSFITGKLWQCVYLFIWSLLEFLMKQYLTHMHVLHKYAFNYCLEILKFSMNSESLRRWGYVAVALQLSSFINWGRPRKPIRALFQARAGTWEDPPTWIASSHERIQGPRRDSNL
jgi:hypothetical protein